jgi:hypothetical protein
MDFPEDDPLVGVATATPRPGLGSREHRFRAAYYTFQARYNEKTFIH